MAKWLKEDEKNERIIRELLRLPGNRHCINCNSLGPRYVCTNFWTFVCTTCSGVHREFTHRVKSVSVSKFTSQEVSALQEGGNQHAKELHLKDLNPQNFPDSSNIERLRDFIRHVYVERRYSGDKSHKPSIIKVVESRKNGQYKKSQSHIEVVGPKFGLSLQRATSSVTRGALRKNPTASSTTRKIPSNDHNWANFDSSAPASQPASNAKTVNGYSNNQLVDSGKPKAASQKQCKTGSYSSVEALVDVFTAIFSSTSEPVQEQYATQTDGVKYPSIVQEAPIIYQQSKSTNPFDMSYESTPVQSQTFPSMASLQLSSPPYNAAQPQPCCSWRMPITTQTWSQKPWNMHYLGHEVGGFNTAFGSFYTSQETSGNLLVSTTQNSFSTIGGNPFGEV